MEKQAIESIGLDTCPMPQGSGEVALFAIDVGRLHPIQPERTALNEDEMARARRFHRAADRDRFVMARHALRLLLARYTGGAKGVGFKYGAKGKPYIDHYYNGLKINFNLSHSAQWVLIGLSLGVEIGVDIEWEDKALDAEGVAKRYFHEEELALLGKARSPDEMRSCFYQLWVAKEAKAKAIGLGLPAVLSESMAMVVGEKSHEDADGCYNFINYFNGYKACCYVDGGCKGWIVRTFPAI